jgi:hypothetical protein
VQIVDFTGFTIVTGKEHGTMTRLLNDLFLRRIDRFALYYEGGKQVRSSDSTNGIFGVYEPRAEPA